MVGTGGRRVASSHDMSLNAGRRVYLYQMAPVSRVPVGINGATSSSFISNFEVLYLTAVTFSLIKLL